VIAPREFEAAKEDDAGRTRVRLELRDMLIVPFRSLSTYGREPSGLRNPPKKSGHPSERRVSARS
jgi:hypothetical protein